MLENIKSVFFQRIVLGQLNDERKTKLVKYSKSLQNRINLNLIKYQLFSGRYILYEPEKEGKLYDLGTDGILFKGDYLHGTGKEYGVFGEVKFEGEYFNGKRNGKGKELYFMGNTLFEGEYFNGKRNGNGKEYYEKGQLKFEGEYFNGFEWNGKGYNISHKLVYEIKNGKGYKKEFDLYSGKMYFEGEFLNGQRNGKGIEYTFRNKKLFEGIYLNGKRWKGKGYDAKGKIAYKIKNGKGFIKEFDGNNIIRFAGVYINGEKNGKGIEFIDGQLIFEGEYQNSLFKKGKQYMDGKLMFDGEFLYGKKRKGKAYVNGKLEYEGEFLFDRKYDGKGYDENGNVIYELIKGNGKVIEYDVFGKLEFIGEYKNGRRNGIGREYHNGDLIYEGEFVNGDKKII